MRILVLTASYLPTINGVSIYINQHKQEMKKMGHQVLILAPKHPKQISDPDVFRLPSVFNPVSPDYPLVIPYLNKKIRNVVFTFKPQVIIFHHPYVINNLAFSLAKQFNIPALFIYHTRYDLYLKSYLPKFFVNDLLLNPVHHSVNQSNLVIAETPTLEKSLKLKYPNAKIQLLVTGLPSMAYTQKTKKELRAIYHLPQSVTILLNVGRLSVEKNLETLIKIYSRLENIDKTHLILVGDGSQKKYLESVINSLGLKDHVTFLGSFSPDLMPQIYSLADIYVYTSLTETQGFTILEAMSAGLPVVALKAPGPQDFVTQNKNGFLTENETEMLKYLKILLSDRNLQKKLSKSAISTASQLNISSWSNLWDQLLNWQAGQK